MSKKKQNKRNRIIEAAIVKIAEKGYHSARMSDIAKEAQVADGTIYNYFQNKEHLLLSIFEDKMTELIEVVREKVEAEKDPLQQFEAFVTMHFEHLQQNPELAQVFQVELRQSQRFFHGYRPEKLFEYLAILGKVIREGQQKGLFASEIDANLLQWSIFGTLDELSMSWVLSEKKWPQRLEDIPKQVVHMFVKGIGI
jgi:TetR/AcrR family transcriptional regulator, fatty acid metabolism regulator protein